MATVQELGALHRRYADTSHRFRAAWTFHQFLQSLGKGNQAKIADAHSLDFQNLYAELKEISQNLNTAESDPLQVRLEGIDHRLGELIADLDEQDTRIAPYYLRQFFRRVKTYDEKIITQLVKFYLYAQQGEIWPTERLDKVDFLLARLSEEEDDRTGEPRLRDHRRLGEIFHGLWAMLGVPLPESAFVGDKRREIEGIRQEVNEIETLDRLSETNLIPRYRRLKHELGNLLFEPALLLAIQETNLVLKSRIQNLYGKEERRIVAEYQRVFELEREVPVDRELDQELIQFRQEIERFEAQLQSQELKLEDLAMIRGRVRELMPRLAAAGGRGGAMLAGEGEASPGAAGPAGAGSGSAGYTATGATAYAGAASYTGSDYRRAPLADDDGYLSAVGASAPESPLAAQEDLLGEFYRKLVDALREVDTELAPERVVVLQDVFPLRIEPREVIAYRRLHSRANCDRELEQFLLESAALRMRINEEAQEISGILDETSVTGDSIVFARARWTARTADAYLWRFHHVLDEAVLSGSVTEGRQLQLLRMRLMRDYSGLWLLAYKPLLKRNPGGTIA
ncbi:MAG TPA: hypothetical protein VKY89_25115 [Thermoanaerobaculia bacterium]|nr:hypothetical protein [Thermoanaerobaculia bacterium]